MEVEQQSVLPSHLHPEAHKKTTRQLLRYKTRQSSGSTFHPGGPCSVSWPFSFALRVSLSVAIVAMVNQTAISDDSVVTTNTSDIDQCPRDQELERADRELTWDRHQQGIALAAFYYGHIVTQVTIVNKHRLCDRLVDILIVENQFHVCR